MIIVSFWTSVIRNTKLKVAYIMKYTQEKDDLKPIAYNEYTWFLQ